MSCDSILLAWPQLNGMAAALHSCISLRVHTKSKLCRIHLLLLHVINLINDICDAACHRYVWKARRLPGWSPQASCWQVGNSQVKMGGGGLYPIHHTLPHMFTCWLSFVFLFGGRFIAECKSGSCCWLDVTFLVIICSLHDWYFLSQWWPTGWCEGYVIYRWSGLCYYIVPTKPSS